MAKQLKLVAACGKKLYIVKLKDIIHFNSNTNNNKTNIPVTSCISNLNNAANQIAVNPILGLNIATNTTTTNDASVAPQTTAQQSKKLHSSIKKGHSAASFMFKNSSNKGEVETPKPPPPPLQHQHSMTTTTSAHCSSSSNLDNNQQRLILSI